MFDAASRSDGVARTIGSGPVGAGPVAAERVAAERNALDALRVRGGVTASFHAARGATHITDLRESGGYRLRFPATHAPHLEATQINTGGGVAGGDKLAFAYAAGTGADVLATTQSAERIYRSNGPSSEIGVTLSLAPKARLDWLPQPTILFSGARLCRRFVADLAPDSRLLMVESVTFGRAASGEVMGVGALHDSWRIRRDGRLIFADATRLDGDITGLLARSAVAGGARALALLLYIAPDAPDCLDAVRGALSNARSNCAASAWNGMLTARFLGADANSVQKDVVKAVSTLTNRPLPRVWQI